MHDIDSDARRILAILSAKPASFQDILRGLGHGAEACSSPVGRGIDRILQGLRKRQLIRFDRTWQITTTGLAASAAPVTREQLAQILSSVDATIATGVTADTPLERLVCDAALILFRAGDTTSPAAQAVRRQLLAMHTQGGLALADAIVPALP